MPNRDTNSKSREPSIAELLAEPAEDHYAMIALQCGLQGYIESLHARYHDKKQLDHAIKKITDIARKIAHKKKMPICSR